MKLIPLFLVLAVFLFAGSLAHADVYDDAVATQTRPAKDRVRDVYRKPAEVLRFFGIEPGMKVFDVFAGSGYYSELLSYLVGEQGSVVLYNNVAWDRFIGKAVLKRLTGDRLPNVTRLITAPESLINRREKYDAAIFILGIHDTYYADRRSGWVAIDRAKFLKGIYNFLADGAVFGVIDANAEAGVDNEKASKDLHRVDPAAVIRDVLAAGFTLEEQSDLLRNPNDEKMISVFAPQNRDRTDRSILKFRK